MISLTSQTKKKGQEGEGGYKYEKKSSYGIFDHWSLSVPLKTKKPHLFQKWGFSDLQGHILHLLGLGVSKRSEGPKSDWILINSSLGVNRNGTNVVMR